MSQGDNSGAMPIIGARKSAMRTAGDLELTPRLWHINPQKAAFATPLLIHPCLLLGKPWDFAVQLLQTTLHHGAFFLCSLVSVLAARYGAKTPGKRIALSSLILAGFAAHGVWMMYRYDMYLKK